MDHRVHLQRRRPTEMDAQPSAVNGYDDSYDDLLNYDTGTSLYAYLNNTTGLILVTNYYTTTGSGAVLDYVQNENVRQGQSGSDILLRSFTYTSNIDSDGNAVYPKATIVEYPDDTDPTITITTSFALHVLYRHQHHVADDHDRAGGQHRPERLGRHVHDRGKLRRLRQHHRHRQRADHRQQRHHGRPDPRSGHRAGAQLPERRHPARRERHQRHDV